MQKTYIGFKGYSIYKESLSIQEQINIRDELTVKPNIQAGYNQNIRSYPLYKESPKKLYIPRAYGIKKFGLPNEVKIPNGINININFNGELRPQQEFIVNKFYNFLKENFGGLLDIYCGMGKTVMTLKLISMLKLKTLVIVHKGFLADQWIERCNEFLPDAKIGRIQGQIIDIEDKDIVIGMLQTLSMHKFPEDQFSEFGFTVVDECHHLSAEVFVQALEKIVTKHILGLSATMTRKDGLTKVFKMFIGNIVHKEIRPQDNIVTVKGIYFKTNDEEFNEIPLDHRGNPRYTTLISKICKFNHRSELIIEIIKNEFLQNKNQQMLILSHQLNLLTYLNKAIQYRNIGSVGFYVGGMKQKDLKESENKQIVLATYSMAAEALDIKTLSSLLLATPKPDVVQAVGRILRIKHENPTVIDIIDEHDLLQKQWLKRKIFYKKNGYKILVTHNFTKDCEFTEENENTVYLKENIPKGKCLIKL